MTIPLLYTIEGIFRGVACDSEKIFSVKRNEYFIWVEQGDNSYFIETYNSLTDLTRGIEIGFEITDESPMERYYGDDYYTITERDICILGRSKDDKEAIITMIPISALLREEKR